MLGLFWDLGLLRFCGCTGAALGLHRRCSGKLVLGLYWDFIGAVLGLHWQLNWGYRGLVMAL